ncbi:mutator type transposase [Tanacetum coccineum]
MFWKCGPMLQPFQKFDKRNGDMKNHLLEAYEWLRKIPPQHWARSHFTGREKSNILLNNLCEVEWNGSDLYQVTCPWGDQFVVNLSERVCSCRKWELSGIPCTHAVASIWDQANNGIDTGIPESYCLPVHWLTTWKEMYKFKINPVNGPQGWLEEIRLCETLSPKPHPTDWQVGHNSRGCKSKKGGGSQQAGVAGHGDAAHGSQQAGVHGSQTHSAVPPTC